MHKTHCFFYLARDRQTDRQTDGRIAALMPLRLRWRGAEQILTRALLDALSKVHVFAARVVYQCACAPDVFHQRWTV